MTVLDWIRKKQLAAFKIGKEYCIREVDILDFENKRATIKEEKNC